MRRKIQEYKMQMLITQNPHVKNPKALMNELDSLESRYIEKDYMEAKLDKTGFAILKAKLKKGSKLVQAK